MLLKYPKRCQNTDNSKKYIRQGPGPGPLLRWISLVQFQLMPSFKNVLKYLHDADFMYYRGSLHFVILLSWGSHEIRGSYNPAALYQSKFQVSMIFLYPVTVYLEMRNYLAYFLSNSLCQHCTENQRANSNLSLIIPVSHFNMISGPVELTTKTTLHYTTDATNT